MDFNYTFSDWFGTERNLRVSEKCDYNPNWFNLTRIKEKILPAYAEWISNEMKIPINSLENLTKTESPQLSLGMKPVYIVFLDYERITTEAIN